MDTLPIGLAGEATITVSPSHSAEAFGSGLVPVFATPALVALVEAAAVRAMDGHLADGLTTVGTRVDVTHVAATPIGCRVTARATLIEVNGRQLTFAVVAHDDHEKIGEGRHERAVVVKEKFLAKVSQKGRGAK